MKPETPLLQVKDLHTVFDTDAGVIKAVNVWDALIRNRSDGALVRITTPILAGEPVAAADQRLHTFLWAFYPSLPRFVPD